ncbi:hypothetical protein ACT4XY_03240 [Acinetobacter baumannii]
MPASNKKLITVDCFPHDNVRRVAYRYGGILKNGNGDTTNPFIEVLLIELVTEVGKGDQWLNLKRCSTFRVPLLEIDAVEQCSIWEGNVLTDEVYNFSGNLVTQKFEFNFNEHRPKNIKLGEKIPYSSEFYIPLKKLYLPQKSDFVLRGYPFTKYDDKTYKNVNHCLMLSTNNIQVIASAAHMPILFSRTKEIRGLLLTTPIDNIINRYLEWYTTEEIEDRIEYKVRFRKPYKNLGENDKIFLTNLALNHHVINVVEILQQSMEIIEFNPYQPHNQTRYPIIYPPHPTNLIVRAEGIWLDDNKTRFLVTNFKKINSITDHLIEADNDEPNTVPKNSENPIPQERSKDKNQHINTQEPPSRVSGEYRQRSNAETENTQSVLRYKFNEPTGDPIEVDSHVQHYTDKSKDVETSSDQPHGNKKTKIKKSENIEKPTPPIRNDALDIPNIIESLRNLCTDKELTLKSIHAIDDKGFTLQGFPLLQIKKLVKKRTHPSWIDDKNGRLILFLQLDFENQDSYCYLIDIKKNKNHESFCACLFFTSYRLTESQIKTICEELESAKGVKKWAKRCDYFIDKTIFIVHKYSTVDEWKNRFKNLLLTLR